MHRFFTNTIFCLFLLAGTAAQAAQPADKDTVNTKRVVIDDMESFSLDDDPGDLIDSLTLNAGEDTYPAHSLYKIWTGEKVNPYEIRLVDMPDTVTIDLAGYCHPVRNRISSTFGFRKWRYHYGMDVKLNRGDSVFCAFDGMVRIARRSRTYGFYVVVRHYNGLETVYAHLSKLLVTPNQPVNAGELVGWGGSTGRSTGPHLHFEMRYLGVAINPKEVIDFENYTLYDDTLYLSAQHFDYIKEIEKIRVWTVRKGDTLGRIAQKTGVNISTLCRLNKISTKTLLRIGQKIRYT